MRHYFDYERLEVYQAARRFNREVGRILPGDPARPFGLTGSAEAVGEVHHPRSC